MQMLVNIDVDDLDRAIRFYEEAFGLQVSRRFGDDAAELSGGPVPIHLLQKAPGTQPSATSPQRRDYRRHWTPVHLDVLVDDIDAAVQRAVAAGATLEQAVQPGTWGHLALLSDPFGHGFCLIQLVGRGYDELATPE